MVMPVAAAPAAEKKPANWIPLPTVPLFEKRKIRVITIGAGYSGLMMAYNIQHKFKLEDFVEHQIYEKNDDVGGTWKENRYPGAACDVPAHIYTFPWEPNAQYTKFYAGAEEIHEYIRRTTKKYNLDKNISYESKVIESIWDDDEGKWKLKIQKGDKVIEDACEVLLDASGILNKWVWPSIEGLHSFKGHLVHSARWDDSYDFSNKRVGVIGNGSTALQLVPSLQKDYGHKGMKLVNFIRSPTWVSATYLSEFTKDGGNFEYTEEEKNEFLSNPSKFLEYRKLLEANFNKFFYVLLKDSPAQKAAFEEYSKMMKSRLNNDPLLCEKLIPSFPVGCRRLSPGQGYLETLIQPNVSAEFTPIAKVTEKGIVCKDGKLIELDAIVCATGFDVSFSPAWKTRGKNGFDLSEAWNKKQTPKGYLSLAAPRMPNYFIFNGPNACAGHGSLLAVMDWTADYVCKWLDKIASEDIKSVTVKDRVINDFNVWAQEHLRTTAWSGGCVSWYKAGGTGGENEAVTGMYPGSVIHYKEMTDNLRPEDFDIDYKSNNSFKFLGNGLARREVYEENPDLAYYIQ